jgi:hypothetical protein
MNLAIKSVKEDHITFAAEVRSKLNSLGDQISELKTHITNRFNQPQAPLIRGMFSMIRNVNEDNRKISLESNNNTQDVQSNNNNNGCDCQLNNNTSHNNLKNMVINQNPLTSTTLATHKLTCLVIIPPFLIMILLVKHPG